jgi:hypothetical protein
MLPDELDRKERHGHQPRPYLADGPRAVRARTRVPQGLVPAEMKGLTPSASTLPTEGWHSRELGLRAIFQAICLVRCNFENVALIDVPGSHSMASEQALEWR